MNVCMSLCVYMCFCCFSFAVFLWLVGLFYPGLFVREGCLFVFSRERERCGIGWMKR